ncbi:hypothetical protein ABNIH4_19949 [Acinetobacter baumannii ABNIH4]
MAQESRLVIVIDSQNAERNARNLGNEWLCCTKI